MNRRAPLIVGLKAEGMAGIILFVMLEGVYMRTLGVEAWARFGSAACGVALFAALPAPWSDLGQPYEALGLAGAHAAGELCILAVETYYRGPSKRRKLA